MEHQECIVYLEVYEKVGDGIVDAFVDFRQSKDYELFRAVTGSEDSDATYIELRSLKSAKRLRSGCYYQLNLELLKDVQAEQRKDSLLIGWTFDLSDMEIPKDDDAEVLQSHSVLNAEEMSMAHVPRQSTFHLDGGADLKLFVKDVEQANWNELRRGDEIIVVYDAGAKLTASKTEISQIIGSRKKSLMASKPVLVISHWDMDHIHCLKGMAVGEIRSCFSMLVCPDKLKTMTATSILSTFTNALGPDDVYCLPLPQRTDGVTMHLWSSNGLISIYQGESSSQPNYCGLVMFVRGTQRSANYTGDCRLSQARNVYHQEQACGLETGEHVLIAPHHGGDCGVNYRSYLSPCNLIEISVGQNRYGHPNKDMMAYLNTMGIVKRTDQYGDIIEDL